MNLLGTIIHKVIDEKTGTENVTCSSKKMRGKNLGFLGIFSNILFFEKLKSKLRKFDFRLRISPEIFSTSRKSINRTIKFILN